MVMAKEMPVMMTWMEMVGESSHVPSVKFTWLSPATPVLHLKVGILSRWQLLQSDVRIRKVLMHGQILIILASGLTYAYLYSVLFSRTIGLCYGVLQKKGITIFEVG